MFSENEAYAIRVSDLSKCHYLYDKPSDRLKQFLIPRFHRVVGLEAPTYHREFWALRDVNFNVKRGEVFGVVGRNGAGKSTLLQLLCGTMHPTGGSVAVHGRVAALLELGSGFNPEFTGRENVFLNASVLGQTEEQTRARFADIEIFADIGSFIDQPVKTYSSGMLVRLAFAVIAYVDADILVIDEALSVGDAFFTQKCMRFLRDFMRTRTVVFVSHDIGAVKNLCTRAIWLDGGRIASAGSPKEVCDQYLESQFSQNGIPPVSKPKPTSKTVGPRSHSEGHQKRKKALNQEGVRNDLTIFTFDPGTTGHATGVCEIADASLADEQGMHVSRIAGGESVVLTVGVKCHDSMANLIVGFYVKDRLGQLLFGDNTFLSHPEPMPISAGQTVVARFSFEMPRLAVGTHHVTLAAASGVQSDFTLHHWIHEAITIVSESTSVTSGLVGIPMQDVSLIISTDPTN